MSCILVETDGLIVGNRLRKLLHWDRSQLNLITEVILSLLTSASSLPLL